MPFAQLVIGPPGSGKTTYCLGMHQFLTAMKRKPVIINLDFANDILPYECAVDVSDFAKVTDIMDKEKLGPNGALIHCMEKLNENFDWLAERLGKIGADSYFIFDCPGQVELFICNDAFKKIISKIERIHFRLASLHLIDSFYLTDPSKFISALVLSLQSMVQLECPHINVLTKIDNLSSFGELAFELEDYAEPSDLTFLMRLLDQTNFGKRHQKLTAALCELIEDFGLISFVPFSVEDKECMAYLLQEVDKANGHVFGSLTSGNESIMEAAVNTQESSRYISLMQSRYISNRHQEEDDDNVTDGISQHNE